MINFCQKWTDARLATEPDEEHSLAYATSQATSVTQQMPVYPENWLEVRVIDRMNPGMSPREAESAAWRRIVRERLGDDIVISYNEHGAPVLVAGDGNVDGGVAVKVNPAGYIGVSHTQGWVAVVWSPEPCAVDIELKTRKISPATAARIGIAPDIAAWCAWEAAYKYRSVAGHDADPSRISFPPHPELAIAVIL